jgi:hypothetical protein
MKYDYNNQIMKSKGSERILSFAPLHYPATIPSPYSPSINEGTPVCTKVRDFKNEENTVICSYDF